MTFIITAGSATDVGRVREGNEDSMLIRPPLYVVADGMGGHVGGEVASALAVETLAAHIDLNGADSLPQGVTEANLAVHQKQVLDTSLAGMGTTLTAGLIVDNDLRLAHVGDSRAYLIRDEEFRMLTDDHTMVGELVRAKRLSPEEARNHPQRSMLTRALGIDTSVEVDEDVVRLHQGDRIILCSDGLNSMVSEEDIEEIARQGAPTAAAKALVDAANAAGGNDNTTVIVIDVGEEDPTTASSDKLGTTLPPVDAAAATAAAVLRKPGAPVPPPLGATPMPAGTSADDGAGDGVEGDPEGGTDGIEGDDLSADADEPGEEGEATSAVADTWSASSAGYVPKPEPKPEREPGEPEPTPLWRSRLVIIAAIITLVVFVTVPIYAYSHTFVGISSGRVAIYHGLPGSILGIPLHSVHEVTEIDVIRLRTASGSITAGLDEGIPVTDDEDALRLIDSYRQMLILEQAAAATENPSPSAPTPEPSPSPSASPSPGSSLTPSPGTSPSPSPGSLP